ncbi:MAG: helix-turn-helix domain-containing protein [Paludibacter sp.]
MDKTKYIQTNDNTFNLVELLMQKIESLDAKVSMLLNPIEMAKLITEDKAAEILGISKRTLINLRKDGKIHYHPIGSSIRYSLIDILEFQVSCRK